MISYRISVGIFLMALSLLTVSCGTQVSTPKKSGAVAELHQYSDPTRARLAFQKVGVKCVSADCPESVGGLVTLDGRVVGLCTAFLVDEDIVATNAHCIPKSVLEDPSVCSSRIKIEFSDGQESFCTQFLQASFVPKDPNFIHFPDYAFLRIEKPLNSKKLPRKSLKIRRTGVIPDKTYKIYRATLQSKPDRKLEAMECEATAETSLAPYFIDSQSPLVAFANCPAVVGDSGSPIVDEAGFVVGILSAASTPEFNSTGSKKVHIPDYHFALGASFRCIPSHDRNYVPPGDCNQDFSQEGFDKKLDEYNERLNQRLKENFDEMAGAIRQWLNQSPKVFDWSLFNVPVSDSDYFRGEVNRVEAKPWCFEPIGLWKQKFLTQIAASDFIQYEIEKFSWVQSVTYNRRMQRAIRWKKTSQGTAVYRFRISEIPVRNGATVYYGSADSVDIPNCQ